MADMVAALEAKLHSVVATTSGAAAGEEKSQRRHGAPAPPSPLRTRTDGVAEPSAPPLLFPTRTVTYE